MPKEESSARNNANSELLGLFAPDPLTPKASHNHGVSTPVPTPIRSGSRPHLPIDSFRMIDSHDVPQCPSETFTHEAESPLGPTGTSTESTPLLPVSNPLSHLFTSKDEMGSTSKPDSGSYSKDTVQMRIRELKRSNSTTTRSKTTKRSQNQHGVETSAKGIIQLCVSELLNPSTWVGAFMFLLFQVVFSLTMGATITRTHGTTSMLGLMTKMAAIGVVFGAPVFWWSLPDIPALYPTVDLFAAPFLAKIALIVDDVLYHDPNVTPEENDDIFLGTYTCLTAVSLMVSGTLLVMTSVFKLADLGSYLPFPVLCGFFSAVGVMTWMLAFKVDSGGLSISEVLVSGDIAIVTRSLIHHVPSVFSAICMKYLGPKNPMYVVMVVLTTILSFYLVMVSWGASVEDMREWGWLYSPSELIYQPMYQPVSTTQASSQFYSLLGFFCFLDRIYALGYPGSIWLDPCCLPQEYPWGCSLAGARDVHCTRFTISHSLQSTRGSIEEERSKSCPCGKLRNQICNDTSFTSFFA